MQLIGLSLLKTLTKNWSIAEMNNLMQNVKTMSSREIADSTNKEHSHVIRDIRLMLSQIDDPNMDDVDFKEIFDNRGYTSEIRLNKNLTFTLIAGYNSKVRYRIVKRWQELEASASQPVIALPDFTNPVEAARAFADQYEAKQIAQEQLAIAQPKAAALDFISTAINSLNARDTAKTLGIQPQKFNKWCIAHNWMYRDSKDKLQMCSNRLQQGFMEQRSVTYFDSNNNVKATTQPLFTAKGLTRLASIFSIVHEVA